MQDLVKLYERSKSTKSFANFFKSMAYHTAKEELSKMNIPMPQIITRTLPAPNKPAQALAHDLIALIFIQWLDEPRFCRALYKLLEDRNTKAPQP